jgi:hypothetical protein
MNTSLAVKSTRYRLCALRGGAPALERKHVAAMKSVSSAVPPTLKSDMLGLRMVVIWQFKEI